MHELSLCRSLISIIENKMAQLNDNIPRRVTAIFLEINALSGVDVQTMEYYFTFVAENTLAESAQLHITVIPMPAKCASCLQDVNMEDFAPCPWCGSNNLIMERKPELLVKNIEVS